MAKVTIHNSDSPGTKLLKLEEQTLLEHPTISPQHARKLVADQNPGLVRLHHEGRLEESAPTVDAGQLINERAHRLLEDRKAVNWDDALRTAMRELPDAAAAWNAGEGLSAGAVDRHQTAAPVRQHVDPGLELMRLTAAAMSAEGLDVDAARRVVLKRDPALAAAYAAAQPLPMGLHAQPATRVDDLVRDGLASFARMQADLAEIRRMAAPKGTVHGIPILVAEAG